MKRIILDNPPNPESPKYKNNPIAWARDTYDWMNRTKQKVETASAQNDTPLSTPFVVSSFTTNTSLTGTSTLGDVANCLCSLIQALTNKGAITEKDLTS